ncbi:MAG: glycosyltransferase family 9 protein [Terriglobia bacterium]
MSQSFLVVRLGAMGDIVHALPAVAALRRRFPAARIDWLVEARWRALVELNPHISNCLSLDTLGWRRGPWHHLSALGHSLAALGRAGYDCAVDFQGLYKSAVLTWLAGARRRVGFHERALREPGSFLFYTERLLPPAGTHVIEMNLALVAHLGADVRGSLTFELPTTAEDEAYVENQLRRLGLEEFFILSPGGGWRGKCWPVERYAELHDALVGTRGWRGVVNVGPGEERLAAELTRRVRAAEPAQFPLNPRQYVALARRARIVISGDSGPLHVAAAVGTPAVGLYGPTDPMRNGPFGPRVAVVYNRDVSPVSYQRTRAYSPAMLSITVEQVLTAMERLAGQASPLVEKASQHG